MAIRATTRTPTDRWGPLPPHAEPRRRGSRLRWLERLFLVVAVLCLGYYGYVTVEAHFYQAYENRELDAILQSAPPHRQPERAPAQRRVRVPAPGSVIGRIEIPRLHVSTIVRAGSDARTLKLAVGHISGTALPGEDGNIGLAGHRDTFFRRLRDIEPGDEIRLVTPEGVFVYHVDGTRIVNPDEVWVLDPIGHPALTLVTCYPFTYIGSAPQRFIVRAGLTEPRRATAIATH
jgi:sortase A